MNSTATLYLKLVGLACYNAPASFSRAIRKGEVVAVPEEHAGSEDDPDSLLGMGRRDSEGALVKPYFKDVTAETLRNKRKETAAAPSADTTTATTETDGDGDTPPKKPTQRRTRASA